MCCTAYPAELSDTILYAAEVTTPQGECRHVLGYKNTAVDRYRSPNGVNAMMLCLPAKQLGPENFIDTQPFRTFMAAYRDALQPLTRSGEVAVAAGGAGPAGASPAYTIFKSGSYTVVSAKSPSSAKLATSKLPPHLNPHIPNEFFAHFTEAYRERDALTGEFVRWPVMIALWSGSIDPEPILVQYEPLPGRERELFLPTLDAHDGKVPQYRRPIQMDHTFVYGSDRYEVPPHGAVEVQEEYAGAVPVPATVPEQYRHVLLTELYGRQQREAPHNGDFYVDVASLRARAPRLQLRRPPGLLGAL